jgi:hypothetical protein
MALWFGCLVYAVLAFSIGEKGLVVYGSLVKEQYRLKENFEAIRKINIELNIRNILLGSNENDMNNPILADLDTILKEARNMGYGLPGEIVVHFNGVERKEKIYIDPGNPEYAFRAKGVSDRILKIISLLLAIALLLCLILPDILAFCRHLQEEPPSFHQRRARLF